MRILLDTHALVWSLVDDAKLPPRVAGLLRDPLNRVFASAVSAYEAAYKHRLGKWNEAGFLVRRFEEVVGWQRFELMSISTRHAARAGLFAAEHRDPFDRLLAAQAEIEELTLATNDGRFTDFGTRTVW
jgi:PIN domain nuclease of toxin-antitoxin system